jgi:hypothetical protein
VLPQDCLGGPDGGREDVVPEIGIGQSWRVVVLVAGGVFGMTLEEVMSAAARPEVRAVVEHRVRHAEIDGPDVVGDVADPVVLSAPAVLAKRDAPELVGSEAVAGFCCYPLLLQR